MGWGGGGAGLNAIVGTFNKTYGACRTLRQATICRALQAAVQLLLLLLNRPAWQPDQSLMAGRPAVTVALQSWRVQTHQIPQSQSPAHLLASPISIP